ncbi:hypothetical protein [Streptomyces litchfieldiae]|uniref:DUF3558 domain-containing protein n=1 Tax=Streptomyces litchfieldiae TaxID=3075543 RepID=A0ABU2MV01_9ACTN|nr:hypothetical protein [Streptomyces sp. DSM 44938]MDT0345301.1 hypothetical protein [Streptomyces sp. DSM 44938]
MGGALIASAAWGGVLFATGVLGGEESADLAGYRFVADLCATADTTAFETDYIQDGDAPSGQSAEDEALDLSTCEFGLMPADSAADEYSSIWITYEVTWHKATDPEGEFAAAAHAFEQYNESEDGYYEYRTETLPGLGDEAYIIYGEDSTSGELSLATVTVRDGWVEYSLSWNAYFDGGSTPLSDHDRVRETLVDATENTLAALKEDAPAPNSV